MSPVEAASQNPFDNQVICPSRGADTDADVDLPLGRDVQIGDGKDLLLLIVQRIEPTQATVVGVVLDATADHAGEVVAGLYPG